MGKRKQQQRERKRKVKAERKVAGLAGLPTAEALKITDTPPAADDERVKEEERKRKAAEKEASMQRVIDNMRPRLRNRALTKLISRDVNRFENRALVLRDMAALIEGDKYLEARLHFGLADDSLDLIAEVYEAAVSEVLSAKVAMHRAHTASNALHDALEAVPRTETLMEAIKRNNDARGLARRVEEKLNEDVAQIQVRRGLVSNLVDRAYAYWRSFNAEWFITRIAPCYHAVLALLKQFVTHFPVVRVLYYAAQVFGAALLEELIKRAAVLVLNAFTTLLRVKVPFWFLRLAVGAAFGAVESQMAHKTLHPLCYVAAHSALALSNKPTLDHTILNLAVHAVGGDLAAHGANVLAHPAADGQPLVISDVCLGRPDLPKQQEDSHISEPRDISCKEKFGARAAVRVADYPVTIFRGCTCNLRVAHAGRVGKHLPVHDGAGLMLAEAAWAPLVATVSDWETLGVRKVEVPIPRKQWVRSFPPARIQAFHECSENRDAWPSERIEASSFVKREKAVKCVDNMVFKDPRLIQGCPLSLSLRCGPYLRRLAKRCRKAWAPHNALDVLAGKHVYYTCGLTAEGIGAKFADALSIMQELCRPGERVVVVEDDQSRFDMHILGGPCRFLHAAYMRFLPRRVAQLLVRRISRGRTSAGHRYSIPYTMQSGWPDTSLGDTMVNVAMKTAIHGKGRRWISIVCGDDSVTVTIDSELDRIGGRDAIVSAYTRFGMEVTCVIRQNILETEFCSGRFYPLGGTWVLMPKPGRFLAKMGWDMVDRNAAGQAAWLNGIAQTSAVYGRVDPVIAAYSRMLFRRVTTTKTIHDRDNYEYKINLSSTVHAVDELDAYWYYYVHYNLAAEDVDALVAYLNHATGAVLDHPILRRLLEVDL